MDLPIFHENKNPQVWSLCLGRNKGKHKARARKDRTNKKQGNSSTLQTRSVRMPVRTSAEFHLLVYCFVLEYRCRPCVSKLYLESWTWCYISVIPAHGSWDGKTRSSRVTCFPCEMKVNLDYPKKLCLKSKKTK